ncbi:FUSC family protein [Streptomyces sp. BH-SS-21]|uniref:FUSC family protein n=2 Tax=Streptomyces liliiviolaceus TaxID=2823109 RepID=A0A940Y5D7_9ACTN|nr:FUSC family protein [Streptomyces liliiviolaceus]
MGALNGVTSDTQGGYRVRTLGITVPQAACAVGLTLGSLVYGQAWLTVTVVTCVALLSGMISALGRIASVSGLLLLLNTVVGAGLPMPGAWWLPAVLMTLGALFYLALALVAWPLRPWAVERASVAHAYRATADLLASRTPDTTDYDQTRRALTEALNRAYELLLADRGASREGDGGRTRLLAQLDALAPLIETAPTLLLSTRRVPAAVPQELRDLADSIATGRQLAERKARTPLGRADPILARGLEHAAAAVAAAHDSTPAAEKDSKAPASAGPGRPRALLIHQASWRYGLRLAVCIGLAQTIISLVPMPRSYWVPLTVTFVLKPDFGSVFSRSVLRVLGTLPGLAVAALALAAVPRGWWDVPTVIVLAALVPLLTPRGYGHQTAAITPLILLLSDLLSNEGSTVLLARLTDSVLGCAITLVAGYLLWPESWRSRVGAHLADTVEDCARYVEHSLGGAGTSSGALRRGLYRDLSAVRTEFERALSEPPPAGIRARAWWPLVGAAERVVDMTTAIRIEIAHGSAVPGAEEVSRLSQRLRLLADRLRGLSHGSSSLTAVSLPVPLSLPSAVLQPLSREVAAMEEVARGLDPAAAASRRARRR